MSKTYSKDLIAPRHQSGDVRNTSAFIGMNEKGKNSQEEILICQKPSLVGLTYQE
jgi:hypothetical protein